MKWLIEVLNNEKEVAIAHGDEKFLQPLQDGVTKILSVAENLKPRLEDERSIQQIENVIGSIQDYYTSFTQYADSHSPAIFDVSTND